MDFLRWIAIWICVPIYKTIPKMYSIFYFLSNARFLSEGVIDELSKNLYVLVSVVMLFAFSATLLSAIVNPDILSDKKKGFWAVFKRAVIGIVLIVALPFMFDLAYDFQASILKNSVIEKLVLGISYSDDDNTIGGQNSSGGKGGQIIAGNLIKSVLRPYDVGDDNDTSNDEVNVEVEGLGEAYSEMIASDITRIEDVAPHINVAPSDDESVSYAFDFDGLIAIIAGGVAVYILLLFAIDMAVRMFNLAFLELTAPISIMAYIGLGNKHLMDWLKEVGHVYLDVFTRIAAMGFYLFLISNLTTFFESPTLWGVSENSNVESISGFGWRFLLQVIIIVGLLIFVNKIPALINKAFGTHFEGKGKGLKGRLQPTMDAINGLRNGVNTIRTGAGRVAGATAAVGANIGARTIGAINRSQLNGDSNRRQVGAAFGGLAAGILTSAGAARRGWQTGNLTALGNEVAREKNTHPIGSTLGGRLADYATSSFGMGTKLSREDDRIARENRLSLDQYERDANGNIIRDANGNAKVIGQKHYTQAQIKELQSQDNRVKDSTQSIIDAANKELDRKDSTYLKESGQSFRFEGQDLKFNNFSEADNMISSLRESGPDAENFYYKEVASSISIDGEPVMEMVKCKAGEEGAKFDASSYYQAQSEYQNKINDFEQQVRTAKKDALSTLVNDAIAGGDSNSWKQYNTSGDSSNYNEASSKITEVNNTMKNSEYAENIIDREIKDYDSLERINTDAEKQSNTIDRKIAERDANISVAKSSDRHRQAEKDAQATKAMNEDNKMDSISDDLY